MLERKRLTSISMQSAASTLALMYGIIGLVVAIVMGIAAQFDDDPPRMGFLLVMPVIYLVAGFIGGGLMSAVYNLVSGFTGGIELELTDSNG